MTSFQKQILCGVFIKVFGPKTDEVTGERRRIHDEELYDLNSSTNVIRVIKKEMGGMLHVWETEDVHAELWFGN